MDSFDNWILIINQDDPVSQLNGTLNLRRILSLEHNPPIQKVINSGVVPRLIHFLTHFHNPKLQMEAMWAITNITSGTNEETNYVIKEGAIPHIINLLKSVHYDVSDQAIWALGNISGDSRETRDKLLECGIVDAYIPLTNRDLISKNLVWAISNLCRGKPTPNYDVVKRFYPFLKNCLMHNEQEIILDALWAVSYLTDGPNDHIQDVLDNGVAEMAIKFVNTATLHNLCVPALRILGNIVTGDTEQTQKMIDFGILPFLKSLLSSPKKSIRKECCWVLSNITAGSLKQINEVIITGVMDQLMSALIADEFEVKKEAFWAISNATHGNNEHIQYLVERGILEHVVNMMGVFEEKMVIVSLECAHNILYSGEKHGIETYKDLFFNLGGVEVLERLQTSDNATINKKSVELLEAYFSADIGEEEKNEDMTF